MAQPKPKPKPGGATKACPKCGARMPAAKGSTCPDCGKKS